MHDAGKQSSQRSGIAARYCSLRKCCLELVDKIKNLIRVSISCAVVDTIGCSRQRLNKIKGWVSSFKSIMRNNSRYICQVIKTMCSKYSGPISYRTAFCHTGIPGRNRCGCSPCCSTYQESPFACLFRHNVVLFIVGVSLQAFYRTIHDLPKLRFKHYLIITPAAILYFEFSFSVGHH